MKYSCHHHVIWQGKHVRLVDGNGWEFVERCDITGIVAILAITDDSKVVVVEQYRPPVQKKVIELPAGLVGDTCDKKDESLLSAAKRELFEETGYEAGSMCYLTEGPPSAGIVSEVVTFFKASKLKKVADGGGDDTEDITVHEVLIEDAEVWLRSKMDQGMLVDPKVYLGLYFANR